MSVLLKNGLIVNPFEQPFYGDIFYKDGVILDVGKVEQDDAFVLDLEGKAIFPGFIDLHSHLREPGYEEAEDIVSGTFSAISGGFTTVVAMPNTTPVCDNRVLWEKLNEKAKKEGYVEIIFVYSGTKGLGSDTISDFSEIEGVVAVSDDGKSVNDSGVLLDIFKKCAERNIVYLSHAEDPFLRGKGVINYGAASKFLSFDGIYNEVEDIRTYRDIALAKIANSKIHICHLSTKGSLEVVKYFKDKGVSVTAEVTPHHFSLIDQDILSNDANFKMNPPLRSKEDRDALIQGIKSGIIDVIATDHAPHTKEKKKLGFDKAPFGIIGFETAVPLSIELLHYKNNISLSKISELLSFNPAKILNISGRGLIKKGYLPYFTVVDINKKTKIEEDTIRSKSKNTPFSGKTFRGKPVYTVIDGKIFDIEEAKWILS